MIDDDHGRRRRRAHLRARPEREREQHEQCKMGGDRERESTETLRERSLGRRGQQEPHRRCINTQIYALVKRHISAYTSLMRRKSGALVPLELAICVNAVALQVPKNALAINGRSFPHGELIEPMVGDTLRWRWINASDRNHPMHLHGFYFRVDAKGDGRVAESFFPHQQKRPA